MHRIGLCVLHGRDLAICDVAGIIFPVNCGAKPWKRQRSCRAMLHDDDDGNNSFDYMSLISVIN